MLRRVSTEAPLVFSGGVARNRCVIELLKKELNSEVLTAEEPDMVGALGAAIYAGYLRGKHHVTLR